jgi:hypothetical protein
MMQTNMNQFNFNAGNGTQMICPEQIKPLYQAALQKGTKFVDMEFPP